MKPLEQDELPAPVKTLPVLGQQMWLRVYNRTIKTKNKTKSENASWLIIKQFYRRNKNGSWSKIR